MKCRLFFCLLFFVFLAVNGSAQENYISNSDFELYKELPTNIGQGKKCLQDWSIPVLTGGGDYYHSDSKSRKAGTAKNYFGKQEPHSGKAYSGICITRTYREFLQAKLKKPLEKGKKYKVELYISSGDAAWLGHMKGFCIIFTEKQIMIPNDETLQQKPDVVFRNEEGYKNTKDWEKLEAIYEANGTEKYMTFGSFIYRERNESVVRTFNMEVPGPKSYAHYYIDDFTLTPVEENNSVEINNTKQTDNIINYETGKSYIFKNIRFEFGKSDLKSTSFNELDKLVDYLKASSSVRAKITGHTDNVGKKEDNMLLSENRAQAVLDYLTGKNIDKNRLSSEGKGDTQPIASNDTEEGKQLNRRVEVVFH